MFKKVSGTKDILPDEVVQWRRLEEISHEVFGRYHYQPIRTPLIEEAGLFNRSLGTTTDIVQKQMFLIQRQQDTYALRPEGTAAIVRAYLENNLDKTSPFIKLYYLGPMFRAERPQRGRLRQFHHIGAEVIGSRSPQVDVELMDLATQLLINFGVTGYTLKLNTLGCPQDTQKLAGLLRTALEPKQEKLCPDCQSRFAGNVLRVLDCKQETCRAIVADLQFSDAFLCAECAAHFQEVLRGLEGLGIQYQHTPVLMRGLDYYTRTVFEIIHPSLGSQDALGAGGRYDTLVNNLGGPETGAMGFALGIERVLLALPEQPPAPQTPLIYLITLGDSARGKALLLLHQLRDAGLTADMEYTGKSLKGALRCAHDLASRFVLLLGDDELQKGVITLKDMRQATQQEIPLTECLNTVQRALAT